MKHELKYNQQMILYLVGLFYFLRLIVGARRGVVGKIGHGSAVVFMLGDLPVERQLLSTNHRRREWRRQLWDKIVQT